MSRDSGCRQLPERTAALLHTLGCLRKPISSVRGQFASGSYSGVSANGDDAFVFSRENLTPQVENGKLVKIYDARVLRGFFHAGSPVSGSV